jgi:sugar phosphate permease
LDQAGGARHHPTHSVDNASSIVMRTSFFYGYVILALCFVNMIVMRGVNGSFSVYYLALLEDFSWSHREGASIASVNFLIYAATSPLMGLVFDRCGPRVLMPLGAALVGAGLWLSSFADSLSHLYLFYGFVVALGQSALGFVGHSALISYWFVRRRATAMGIASMGQGLGALIMVPTTQILIDRFGWRAAFTVTGTVIFLALVPANTLLQRRRPEELGQLPDGATSAAAAGSRQNGELQKPSSGREWTLRSATKSFPFWCITTGHLALGTALFLINTHLVAHFVSRGLDKLLAAFLFGVIGFTRLGGTLVWGIVSDRLGRDRAYGIATAIAIIGLAGIIAIPHNPSMGLVYLVALLYSIGHSAGTPTYGAVIADIFAGRQIGVMFGLLEISFGVGSALGAWFGGYVFDVTGSYDQALGLCLFCFALSALAIHLCIRWQSRQTVRTDCAMW